MEANSIRDEKQLAELLEEMRPHSVAAQIGRLEKMRQGLELDEMYYEQKGHESGLARTTKCLALIDARLAELRQG